jgi:hypothetical protein
MDRLFGISHHKSRLTFCKFYVLLHRNPSFEHFPWSCTPSPTFDSSCIIRLVCTLHSGRWYPVASMKHQIDFIVFKTNSVWPFWNDRGDPGKVTDPPPAPSRAANAFTTTAETAAGRLFENTSKSLLKSRFQTWKCAVLILVGSKKKKFNRPFTYLRATHPSSTPPGPPTLPVFPPKPPGGLLHTLPNHCLKSISYHLFFAIANFIHSCPLSSLLPTEL